MDYFTLSKEELGIGAKIPIAKRGSAGEVFYEFALDMLDGIERNNAEERPTVFICPVGPVGQYPIFVRLANERRISLQRLWMVNMDEYLNDDKTYIDTGHRLSFRGFMQRNVYDRLDPALAMPPGQRIFPDPAHPEAVPRLIEELGGVDTCYGGIGITGHLAFNEPEDVPAEEFGTRMTRMLRISPETRTINAASDLNGAVAAMPQWCITIGMKEILASKKIRLYCFRDWHRAVVRQAAYGEKTGRFPATLAQDHPDARITISDNVAEPAYT